MLFLQRVAEEPHQMYQCCDYRCGVLTFHLIRVMQVKLWDTEISRGINVYVFILDERVDDRKMVCVGEND